MLKAYAGRGGFLVEVGEPRDAVWIDLLEPTKDEEHAVEALLGIDVPSREEMREVESSSQIYKDGDAVVMTLRILRVKDRPSPELTSVTFMLTPERLVTLRYAELTPFNSFVTRAGKETDCAASSYAVMSGLLETIVDRVADILEGIGDELDMLSTRLFAREDELSRGGDDADLQAVLKQIGRSGDLASRARESLHGISRMLPVLNRSSRAHSSEKLKGRLLTLRRDVLSLQDHDAYLVTKIQFLLDASLGLISIQQNAVIKILSVAAVIFLPPTLIASVFGMNFEHMPELKWAYGYPYGLGLMVVSAVVPYWYFKRRKWL